MSTQQDSIAAKNHTDSTSVKQTSASLFDYVEPKNSQALENTIKSAGSKLAQESDAYKTDIAAVSLSVNAIDDKIPTVTPKKVQIQSIPLKTSQLGHLSSNQLLIEQTMRDAAAAAKLLEETKATYARLQDTLDISEEHEADQIEKQAIFNDGIEKCDKILREAQFIHAEIKRLYAKIEAENSPIEGGQKLTELQNLVDSLSASQQKLDLSIVQNQASTQQHSGEIQQQLDACAQIRKDIDSKEQHIEEEIKQFQDSIQQVSNQACAYITQSEESLALSREAQSHYIALSREMGALKQELSQHQKNASSLNADIQSANQAITLNKIAVEALTNDMVSLKSNLRLTKKSTHIDNSAESREMAKVESLLAETQNAHKRINQLLHINNTVSDRISKIDQAIYNKSQHQDQVAAKQSKACDDIEEQKEACRRLIEQANRSHTLIVNACKKTTMLADQIETLTEDEKKQRNAILAALKENRHQKSSLSKLQALLENTHQQQLTTIEELHEAHLKLVADDQQTQQQLALVDAQLIKLEKLVPELHSKGDEFAQMGHALRNMLDNNASSNQELQALQHQITCYFKDHKRQQAVQQDEIQLQLKAQQDLTQATEQQHIRLHQVDLDINNHLATLKTQAQAIDAKIEELASHHSHAQILAKDIDFSTTQLGYLKQQVDELLQNSIQQTRDAKQQHQAVATGLQQLDKLRDATEKAMVTQQAQEENLDQLNILANKALETLNQKLDRFSQIQDQCDDQHKNTKVLQDTIGQLATQQQKQQTDSSATLVDVKTHLERAQDLHDNLQELERKVFDHAERQATTLAIQSEQIDEQNKLIISQSALLDKVDTTHLETLESLKNIEDVRKKAQQSFAHLSTQKNKIDGAFNKAAASLESQAKKVEAQDALLSKTSQLASQLEHALGQNKAFEAWQQEIKQSIQEKLVKIDEYQSRAFQAQQTARVREKELEAQHQAFEAKFSSMTQLIQNLEATRHEEAQYRDELKALVRQQEQQQRALEQEFTSSRDRHQQLSDSLEEADLLSRENKVATKETQMANRETKLILQEIRREINSVKPVQSRDTASWASESRLEALEKQLDQPAAPFNITQKPEKAQLTPTKDTKGPSSFML